MENAESSINDIVASSAHLAAKNEDGYVFDIEDIYCEIVWVHFSLKHLAFVCLNASSLIDKTAPLKSLFFETHRIEHSRRLHIVKQSGLNM
jgi:hypothetical protein